MQPGDQNADGAMPPRDLDTFPKLLRRNARTRGDRPAFRYKEFGVWRSWSWAETYAEIRTLAQGFVTLGVARGDAVAIAGGNRPKLYWAMTAAQMAGAIPVPVYADAVAEELAYVLENAGVRMVVAQDQEQVDKALSVAARLPALTHVLYDETRGVTDYQDGRLVSLDALTASARSRTLRASARRSWPPWRCRAPC